MVDGIGENMNSLIPKPHHQIPQNSQKWFKITTVFHPEVKNLYLKGFSGFMVELESGQKKIHSASLNCGIKRDA